MLQAPFISIHSPVADYFRASPDWTADTAVPTCVYADCWLCCLSKLLSLKQKSINPAYNSCSRFR